MGDIFSKLPTCARHWLVFSVVFLFFSTNNPLYLSSFGCTLTITWFFFYRDLSPDTCRSDTTETGRPATKRRSTYERTSSPRDTSWTPTDPWTTNTSGSTARPVVATWKSCPEPAASVAASGWNDGSCSIGGPGRWPITTEGPTRTLSWPVTGDVTHPQKRRSHVPGLLFIFKYAYTRFGIGCTQF